MRAWISLSTRPAIMACRAFSSSPSRKAAQSATDILLISAIERSCPP